ncbi:hypothetical protein P280DRAFT_513504 [Massarina eburnea CBS 473.64]|uniref:Mid2 domain-containing protein n=1 Tax=Massarina eburnea CBS 473.64 TaxID=1395130 RepID=A0A6A6SGP4_9PLEO|nr:hypothetical protein P280DRAFT_513504 [Massarina eburnea CBS 473.64]
MSLLAETNGREVTSWIPLTSVFKPSPGCESVFRLNGPSLVAFDPGYGLDINTGVKCAPSAVTTWWEQARLGVGGDDHTALSIQPLTCPDLWTTVATFTKNTSTTQIMCCPSGYSNQRSTSGPVNGNCISSISRGMVLTYASTASTASTDWSIVTTTMSASSSVGAIAVVGFNVARVSPSSTSSPASSLASPTSSPPSSPSPSFPVESSSTKPPAEDSMSTGIKVGIGLGVTLGMIGIIALIFAIIMLRRRSQSKSRSFDGAVLVPASDSGHKPIGGVHQDPQEYRYPLYELHGNYQPHELPPGEARSPVEIGNEGG